MRKALIGVLAVGIVLMAGFCAWGDVVINENTFPDAVFRAYVLSADVSIDKNQDRVLSDDEISEVTEIDVTKMGISSLKGIEYFTALMTLDCSRNQLTELDVSSNSALMTLDCSSNQLTTLDISNNTVLGMLGCGYNQLTELDVSSNAFLTYLEFTSNDLTEIDVSNNINLTALGFNENHLTMLDVSKNTALEMLDCSGNQLTTLDLSNNTALTYLECGSNQLTTLDLSNNPLLISLSCSNNQLTSLNVSGCSALYELWCSSNDLTALDVSGCSALSDLWCYSNQLTTLDVSKNTDLKNLYCDNNQFTALDVSKNTALWWLGCGYNQLTALDLSSNPELSWLDCYGNQLTTLDVSKNTALTSLMCWDNDLTTLDVSKNTALSWLYCGSNDLTALDVSNNTDLTSLSCGSNHLTALDVSNNTALMWLDCSSNDLTALDVSSNTAMTWLECFGDHLTALDVSKNTALEYLDCNTNQLSALDVTNNSKLKDLHCHTNNISSLNLSNNPELMRLRCYNNKLMNLDVSSNTKLVTLDCYSNYLPILDVSVNTFLDSEDVYLVSLDPLYRVYRNYINEPWSNSRFSSQTLALPQPKASGGTAGYPYALNLNTIAASYGVNFNFADFLTHASSLRITDSSDNAVNCSADVSGIVYFSSIPAQATYLYNAQYSGFLSPAPSMDVTVNFIPLTITLTNAVQTITAGSAISPITYTVTNSFGSLSFGTTALPPGITQSGDTFSGTISADGTYSFTVTVTNSQTAETASATAAITVIRAVIPESGDVISENIPSGDITSDDPRPTPSTPDIKENSVEYAFDVPSGVIYRMAMLFGGENVYQFTDDEIVSDMWELDEADTRAIADLNENVVLHLPVMRPKNSGMYMLKLNLSGTGAGKKISLYGITSGSGNISASSLEKLDYILLDEDGSEISEVPENGIVYAALRLTANREHRGVITSPIELKQGTIQPFEPDETLLEKIAETVKISADRIMFITEKNISEAQEPTDAMRSELAAGRNEILGKFNTVTVDNTGYYVLKVTLSDDLYERIESVSVNELKVYAMHDDGLMNTLELLTLTGEKMEFGVKEFLMVGFLQAGTPYSMYLTQSIPVLSSSSGGCDSGVGIAGFAVMALGAVFLIIRRKL